MLELDVVLGELAVLADDLLLHLVLAVDDPVVLIPSLGDEAVRGAGAAAHSVLQELPVLARLVRLGLGA